MERRPLQTGDLVVTRDGYYALVLSREGAEVTVFNSNGVETPETEESLRPLSLKVGENDGSPASFGEVFSRRNKGGEPFIEINGVRHFASDPPSQLATKVFA